VNVKVGVIKFTVEVHVNTVLIDNTVSAVKLIKLMLQVNSSYNNKNKQLNAVHKI